MKILSYFSLYFALCFAGYLDLSEGQISAQHLISSLHERSEANLGNLYACPRCNGRRVPPAGPRKGPANV